MAVSILKPPPAATCRDGFGIETVINFLRFYVMALPQRTQVTVRVWRLCNGRGRWPKPTVYSGVGIFIGIISVPLPESPDVEGFTLNETH